MLKSFGELYIFIFWGTGSAQVVAAAVQKKPAGNVPKGKRAKWDSLALALQPQPIPKAAPVDAAAKGVWA